MFKYLSLIIGLCTAELYMHGQIYWDGYLSSFGLRSDILTLSFEEALMQGYLSFAILGMPVVIYSLAFTLFLIVIASSLNELTIVRIFQAKFDDTRAANGNKAPTQSVSKFLETTTKRGLRALAALLIFIVIVYGSLFTAVEIDTLGKDAGVNKLDVLSKSKATSLLITKSGSEIEGTLITCNSGFCGVIVDGVVSLVPLSDVYTIVNQ